MPRDIASLANALRHKRQEAQPAPRRPEQAAPPSAKRAAQPRQDTARDGDERRVTQRLEVDDLQDLVLADLLQHPLDARPVLEWLPADVFETGKRRTLYDAIRDKVTNELPIDPLIIAWGARGPSGERRSESALDPEYVLRAGALTAAPGTAATLGRALLADHTCTQLFGADWPRSTELAERDAPQALQPDPESAPEQSVPAAVFQDGTKVVPASSANARKAAFLESPPDLAAGPAPEPRM